MKLPPFPPSTLARRLSRILAAGLLACLPVSALYAASAEPIDMDPGTRAKLAREKGKQSVRNAQNQEFTQGAQDGECGNINIGNADTDAQNARARLNPRDTTVIITGDVFNTARCR